MKEKFLRELADIQTGPFGSQLHKEFSSLELDIRHINFAGHKFWQ